MSISEVESEGHEEKYRAVIDGETQDEPVGQRWGKVESAILMTKAFSFTHRTKVFAGGTVRKKTRDLRRTGRVSGWHRSKRTYKRKRSGERGSVSSRTAEEYL